MGGLKENQGQLYEDVRDLFEGAEEFGFGGVQLEDWARWTGRRSPILPVSLRGWLEQLGQNQLLLPVDQPLDLLPTWGGWQLGQNQLLLPRTRNSSSNRGFSTGSGSSFDRLRMSGVWAED